jgi:proline racemase
MPDAMERQVGTIDAHVAGAAVRLIVGGWPQMRGRDFASRLSRLHRRHDDLRIALMHEPRGHAAMTGALLLEPSSPEAHAAMAFMGHDGWLPFCGHALMGAVAIATSRGLIQTAGGAPLRVETAAGVVEVRVRESSAGGGEAGGRTVSYVAPAARLVHAMLRVPVGQREVAVDLAWCGGLYALVDAEAAGVPLDIAHAADLARAAEALREAIGNRVLPTLPTEAATLEGVTFLAADDRGEVDVRSATVYAGGMLDRSPGGGTTGAVMAVLDAMGLLAPGRPFIHRGPCGTFTAEVITRAPDPQDQSPSLVTEITATAWVTGEHTFHLAAGDPSVPAAPSVENGVRPRFRRTLTRRRSA